MASLVLEVLEDEEIPYYVHSGKEFEEAGTVPPESYTIKSCNLVTLGNDSNGNEMVESMLAIDITEGQGVVEGFVFLTDIVDSQDLAN
ncbi:hypothetical protein IH575_00925 [Candidatus Dojkabacteria bacterium]|nr:hypothetical protein [Candidatus Dojkabacteria bacterium]